MLRRTVKDAMRSWRYYSVEMVLIAVLGGAVAYFAYLLVRAVRSDFFAWSRYSGERAQFYVTQQVEFGPRVAGSEAALRRESGSRMS